METTLLTCPKCFVPLSSDVINRLEPGPCAACGNPLIIQVFPALFREHRPGSAGELAVEEGQATCFYHPQKTASVPCDACGRFICALCDVELHGEHLCPACVETGRQKGKITTLESKRTLHDNIALSIALLPFLAWPLTVITAPATLIYAVTAWKKPSSIVPRTKARFVIAIIIALLTLAGWGVAAALLYKSFTVTEIQR
jgi:hypothetical protein